MATTTTTRQRMATPARWQAALQRARDEGIELFQIAGTGECIATSASRPGVAYRTNGIDCECEAAQLGGDPVCKHRAIYHFTNGTLQLDPEPDTAAPAVAAPAHRCTTCQDAGSVVKASILFAGQTYRAACPACRTIVDLAPFLAAKYGRRSVVA